MPITYTSLTGGVTQKVQEFTSTGTFTAPSNCSSVEVFLVGGGGGGGGVRYSGSDFRLSGSGGGSEVVKKILPVTPGSSYTVTIGAGGSAGVYNAAGGVGGDTTFGALATAQGGGGGASRDTNTVYHGTARGSAGGNGAGNGANGVGGAGGGAGGSAIYNVSTTQPFNFPSSSPFVTNNNLASKGAGGAGGKGTSASSTEFIVSIAGIGIDGYGNGAPGIICTTTGNNYYITSSSYAGITTPVANQSSLSGTAGTANTGNGGTGSAANSDDGSSQSATGGAGGSGYARVVYWS